jgi:hypothetical protein
MKDPIFTPRTPKNIPIITIVNFREIVFVIAILLIPIVYGIIVD